MTNIELMLLAKLSFTGSFKKHVIRRDYSRVWEGAVKNKQSDCHAKGQFASFIY